MAVGGVAAVFLAALLTELVVQVAPVAVVLRRVPEALAAMEQQTRAVVAAVRREARVPAPNSTAALAVQVLSLSVTHRVVHATR